MATMFHSKPTISNNNDPTSTMGMCMSESESESESPRCPRCASSHTKFCYYNNYSLSQPRYFCKGCRRYWTKGGSLRNVPVGGNFRKNRRSKQPSPNNPNPHHSLDPTGSDSGRVGPDIDLAVVFANWVAPDSEPNKDSSLESLSGISSNVFGAQNNEAEIGISGFEEDVFLCEGSLFGQIQGFSSSSLSDGIWSSFDLSGFEVFSTS